MQSDSPNAGHVARAPMTAISLGAAVLMFGSFLGPLAGGATAPASTAASQDEPAVPSSRHDIFPEVEELIAVHDCLACHGPDEIIRERLHPSGAPSLSGLSQRVPADWLEAFLLDPRGLRPGTHHPHQLASLAEGVRGRTATVLTHFLMSTGEGPAPAALDETSSVGEIERGRAVFHSVGCVACHGPLETLDDLSYSLADLDAFEPEPEEADDPLFGEEEGDGTEPVPIRPGVLDPDPQPLPADLASRYRISTLSAFLKDPVALRPSGFCPSMGLDGPSARAVAAYLLREQAQRPDGSFDRRPGLLVEVFEGEFGSGAGNGLGLMETLTAVKATSTLAIDLSQRTRDESFGMRFSGLIDVREDGEYTFHLLSDDGSDLTIDGARVVDNGGVHAPRERSGSVELVAGFHAIDLRFFEAGGGEELTLEWEGPGIERGPLPAADLFHLPLVFRGPGSGQPAFEVDEELAATGEAAFVRLACARCHTGVVGPASVDITPNAPSLSQLAGVRPGVLVCLRPDGRYGFDPATVGSLLSAFVDPSSIAAEATTSELQAERHLARRRCYACHRRDGIGGVHPSIAPYYTGDEEAELGDQGRFPPTLTAVGRKFKPAVLRRALAGQERVRPYLNTRMPQMGRRNMADLANLLEATDHGRDTVEPVGTCDVISVDTGRRLAGDKGGLGCVQCHDFLGNASLGVRAVDMGTMARRLQFGWFRELLLSPSNVDLDGRMANLWVDGKSPVEDLAGGAIDAQIEAIWCWLQEGASMAPPPGLDSGPFAYEIDPSDGVRLVSVFMKDVSARVLCIGTPAGVHQAFDFEHSRLAKAWRGRFLNALGTWKGRAGALEKPASSDVFDFAPGLAIAGLDAMDAPWPTATGRDAMARALGRTLNGDGSVTLRYAIGDLRVAETVAPKLVQISMGRRDTPKERWGVERRFEIRAPATGIGSAVVARVAAARLFDRVAQGRWRINGEEWPLFTVDRENARAARVLEPRVSTSEVELDASGRPVVDSRDRGQSSRRNHSVERPLEELRIPILMRPSEDGSGDLVGSFTWSVAW